ncbi:MAG: hypothetical protein II374_05570 [Lachnospiraceae bacterium]|nr:hypothetical protein [Lachnospiraceae bacterium]
MKCLVQRQIVLMADENLRLSLPLCNGYSEMEMDMFFRRKKLSGKKGELEEKVDEETGAQIDEEVIGEETSSKESSVAENQFTREHVKPVSKDDIKRVVRENCEMAGEVDTQIKNIKHEYEKVTSALTDMQKIDRITGEDRKELIDICKNIVNLVKERNNYKNRTMTITESQMRKFEPYEEILVDEIRKMYGAEAYQKAIESDISNLKKEKRLLRNEHRDIVERQTALKSMAIVLSVLIISLFVLFVVIYYTLKIDMTFPYLGTVLLAAISSTVIFIESNKNRRGIAVNERKMNKAISYMNKVKIKYVNNVNMLDYNCEKYGVTGGKDFENKWNEYCRMKEFERRFRENTDKLNFNSECLMDILKENEVVDREKWISNAIAIIDDREMVEIRHDLNQQRQKLRERIEYNEGIKANLVKEIDELISENKDMQNEIIDIVKQYNKNITSQQ